MKKYTKCSQAINVEQEIMKKYTKCSQATIVEQEIMKKRLKMYYQATNVEWKIIYKKYTKCTVKLQLMNVNNEKMYDIRPSHSYGMLK